MSTILIADDSKFMRSFLKTKLQQHGYQDVIEAADGQEAINVYEHTKPDIVFLDITMPNVGGLTALEKILDFDSNAKVVMCSAMATKSNVNEALHLGARDFIVKPNFGGLKNTLKKLDSSA
ncbi:response regulator [Oceanobacillus damuensis]|uniref:response regulator n=1 Tax=Oceanobacillus damuensis TaxID=937928 RepID=UPI000836CE8C|nr:response regulator [Oceanobacillus damuensis]